MAVPMGKPQRAAGGRRERVRLVWGHAVTWWLAVVERVATRKTLYHSRVDKRDRVIHVVVERYGISSTVVSRRLGLEKATVDQIVRDNRPGAKPRGKKPTRPVLVKDEPPAA